MNDYKPFDLDAFLNQPPGSGVSDEHRPLPLVSNRPGTRHMCAFCGRKLQVSDAPDETGYYSWVHAREAGAA